VAAARVVEQAGKLFASASEAKRQTACLAIVATEPKPHRRLALSRLIGGSECGEELLQALCCILVVLQQPQPQSKNRNSKPHLSALCVNIKRGGGKKNS